MIISQMQEMQDLNTQMQSLNIGKQQPIDKLLDWLKCLIQLSHDIQQNKQEILEDAQQILKESKILLQTNIDTSAHNQIQNIQKRTNILINSILKRQNYTYHQSKTKAKAAFKALQKLQKSTNLI